MDFFYMLYITNTKNVNCPKELANFCDLFDRKQLYSPNHVRRRGLGRIIERRYRQHGIIGPEFFISLSSCIFVTLFLFPGQIPEWNSFWGQYFILRIWQPARRYHTAMLHNHKLCFDLRHGLQTRPPVMAQGLAFYGGIIQCRTSVFL